MVDAPDDEVRAALERAIGFQYEIVRLLGRGGMGAVYQAHERALDRSVAIKVLPPDVAGTTMARERFLREARTAARLTHPNIVPLFTFGEAAGLIYYVMGYVEGESLQQRLDRGGGMEPTLAARLLAQLANALDYAHTHGIVHRDVKPDNILLERGTGDVKLTDFGIAKQAAGGETLTGTGLLMGTPRYMSPEQAAGDRDLDARSDIYALGLVGYAMLTGKPPFDGASVQEVLRQQVMRDAPRLRSLLPDAPSSLVTSIEKALEKDAKARWQSGKAMATALSDDEDEVMTPGGTARKPGIYAFASLFSTLITLNVAWAGGWRINPNLFWFMLLTPVGPLIDYAVMKYRHKLSSREIRRMFTQPPRWWPYWWPTSWRRPDDVWSRLPADLRQIRSVASLSIALGLATIQGVGLVLIANTGKHLPWEWRDSFASGVGFGLVGSLVLLSLSVVMSLLWGRKRGLSADESVHIASVSTARVKYWTRPEIAKLLRPVSDEVTAGEPRSYADLVSAIAGAVADLPEHREAADAARNIVAAIGRLDDEIARLSREADPAEIARLDKKLESMGSGEMRKLYESQLELLRRLDQQRVDAESRRTRYAELLRTLWLQVASLRAQMAADNADATDLSGRIRALCRSVEVEVAGLREVAALLPK